MFHSYGYSLKSWRLAVLVVLCLLTACDNSPWKTPDQAAAETAASVRKSSEVVASEEASPEPLFERAVHSDGRVELLPYPMTIESVYKYMAERRKTSGQAVETSTKDATLMPDGTFTYEPESRLAEIEAAKAKGLDVQTLLKPGEVSTSHFRPTIDAWTSPSGVQYVRFQDRENGMQCWLRNGQVMTCGKF